MMNLTQITEGFANLSVRERALVLGAACVATLFLGLQLFVVPLIEEKKSIRDQRAQNTQSVAELSAEIQVLRTRLANNPNDKLRDDIQALEKRNQDLRDNLTERVAALLSPRQTQQLLRDVLAEYKGLSLVSARNMPPSVIEVGTNDPDEAADEKTARVYEHGFEITLTGSYFETRDYLKRLEALDGFFWQRLEYEVVEYPEAKVVLGISTLSVDEAWIGG